MRKCYMYPVECGPSLGSNGRAQFLHCQRRINRAIRLENDQIVAVNHFFIVVKPGKLLNVGCLKSLDTGEDLGRKVDEAFGALLPIWSDACDRITGIEAASGIQDTGSQ